MTVSFAGDGRAGRVSRARALFIAVSVLHVLANLWIDLAGKVPAARALELATKPLLMPLLAALLYAETRGRPDPRGFRPQSLYAALAFGWVGDVLLMLPPSISERLPLGAFIWGAGAFLLGHVCYVHVFLRGLRAADVLQPRRLLLALPLLVYGYVLFSAMRGFLGAMTIPVAVYMLALLANAFSAYARFSVRPAMATSWVLLGALLFLQSDSILAVNQFMFVQAQGHPMGLAGFAIMATYILGQFLLVHGNVLEAYGEAATAPAPARLWTRSAVSRA